MEIEKAGMEKARMEKVGLLQASSDLINDMVKEY